MTGELGILNVGAGDTKLSFDPTNPAEVKRASAVVKDMLQRGYAIFIEAGRDDNGPLYRRATAFDATTAEYLIVGAPEEEEASAEKPVTQKASRRGKTTRVAASKSRGVAVARVAGG